MISMSVLEPICSPCSDRQHALITALPFLRWSGLFKFPVCPMRIETACPLDLCSKNVTFDSCAALLHPVAHVQCGPVSRGSAEEVSVITCTTFCTSLRAPHPHHLSAPQLPAAKPQTLLFLTTANTKVIIYKLTCEHYIWSILLLVLDTF